MFRPQLAFFYACGFRHEGACHDSSRVSAMPTSRAYGTRYAIHPNMLTHDLHGPHAVIINMDLRVHGHVLYKRRHACSTTTNGCLGRYIKSTTWPQYKYTPMLFSIGSALACSTSSVSTAKTKRHRYFTRSSRR